MLNAPFMLDKIIFSNVIKNPFAIRKHPTHLLIYPNPIYPNPIYPNPIYPNPIYPNPIYPNPIYPNPIYPKI